MTPPQSALMPSRSAPTAARIRLWPVRAESAWRLPSGSTKWTAIVAGALTGASEAAEVFARLPCDGVLGRGVPLDLRALDAAEPVDDLRRECSHQRFVGDERVERFAEARRQRLAGARVRSVDGPRRDELALDAVEAGMDLSREVQIRIGHRLAHPVLDPR